ncbi:MAG TPA: Na+/H+ antiporter subunit E [Geminicoccus sp.]|uniref:Na+/H+ antiporter subunit E n=1 Tax=Geminicoccus sp. TaxID=2024832 RepID=UPI002E35D16B|nr:Na+/H+ antiporter subunit E [Geminicoccus sp.]HEX2525563.1 Na+/H+ antiporter subunit E [Geminicoccus sp.]
MLDRFLPHPLLTFLILIVWVFLLNDVSAGAVILGLILGLIIPIVTSAYWPGRASLKAPLLISEYLLIVGWDILVSNFQVAYLILFRKAAGLRSRYVTVPIDLTSPEAIAVLAGTITLTPGTVTADLSADGKALLVHCLETDDPDGTVANIKNRYERRLKRMFE